MAEVKSLFKEYLTAIEPDSQARRLAAKAPILPRDYLMQDDTFGRYVNDSFLYGSYRRRTATHDIKDVDIMLITSFDPDAVSPATVLNNLFEALKRCYGSERVLKKNRRSIQVLNPLPDEDTELTLDILPAVEVNDGSGYLLVPDKDEREWILTNPRGHIDKVSEANAKQDKKLVPMVKIMKAWWRNQSADLATKDQPKPRPKSFWIETLVLNYFTNQHDNWAERFLNFVQTVTASLPADGGMPYLADPGMPETQLKTSMDQDEFNAFIDKLHETEQLAIAALDEPDRAKSSKLWAEIFGDDFPTEEPAVRTQFLLGRNYSLGDTSHARNLALPLAKLGEVTVTADLYRRNYDNNRLKVRLGPISSNASVKHNLHIQFRAKPLFQLKFPYDVYWRVVNTGSHAENDKGLRGQPFVDHTGSELVRWEPTKYTGKHWIECFIVQGEKIIATSERFYVNITNPNWTTE
jgi:hypothetical protein